MTPSPRPPDATPTESPLTASPSPSPSPVPTRAFTSFSDSGYGFDYPSDWRVIAERVFDGADWIPLVVGTGEWSDGCSSSGSGTVCTGSVFMADPGEVVAEFSYQIHGPAIPVYEVPPFDARLLEDGAAVATAEVGNGTRAVVNVPGRRSFVMNIKFGSPATEADRATVDLIVGSFRFDGKAADVFLETWNPGAAAGHCAREQVRGRLGRGDFGDLNLLTANGFVPFVQWPPEWQARIGETGRAEVVDESGNVAAREWDEVALGGRGDHDEFRVCPDAVTVVRAFPRTTAADE